MEWLILLTLIILIALVILILIRMKNIKTEYSDPSAKIEAAMKDQFLNFQTNIHQELNRTQREVERSKDVISKYTIETIKTIKEMDKTIHNIAEQQKEAEKLGQSLRDLLQTPKLRGSYGEAILEEMLDKILPKGIWEAQYTIEGGERVDCVVKIKEVIVPIDAKFPRDAYLRYLDATDQDEKAGYWNEYETALKTQIKSIGSKYVKPERGTTDFALMFIPSEAIYYETIAEKNYLGDPCTIYEFAQQNKVVPVSPNTFYAFLQIVVLGIRNIEVIESAKKLQEGLTKLERHFELFYKQYDKLGKSVEKAAEAYRIGDGHIDRYKRQLEETLKLEALPEKSTPLLSNNNEKKDV